MYIKKCDRELLEKIIKCCNNNPLPKDIGQWLDSTVFKEHKYIFYKTTRDKVYGYCQNCKYIDFEFKRIKTQKFMICPNCHKKMKLRNYLYKNTSDSDYFHYISQLDDESFIIRTFKAIRVSHFLDYHFDFCEIERHLIKIDFYNSNVYYSRYLKFYNYDWSFGCYRTMNFILSDKLFVYNKNLNILNKGCLKYYPFKKICSKYKIDIVELLCRSYNFKQNEYLLKLDLINLVMGYPSLGFCDVDFKENNIKKFLKLNTIYFKYLCRHNLTINEFENLQILQKINIKPNKSNLKFINLVKSVFPDLEIFNKINFKTLKKYYSEKLKSKDMFRDYRNYLDFGKELGYNFSDTKYIKPKNFKIAHDLAYKKINCIRNKNLYAQVDCLILNYKKLNYISDKYSIVVPNNADDIVQEGINMKNCVATYLDRVAKKQSIILFVRHTNDLQHSFYTLEINPANNSIVQCRGFNNEITAEEKDVQKFVKDWRNNILLKSM